MNFKKRLKQAFCISAAVAVSFTSVYAEPTPDPEDYPENQYIYVEPWQNEFIQYLLKLGGKFPTNEVINEYNFNSTGTLNLNVSLVSYTDEENNTIEVTSTTDINETIGKHYIDGTQSSYINVPKLTFKSTGTNSSFNTVQNKIECNKVSGTYGFTVNAAGTQGTLNLPNYSCTYSPYGKTELDSVQLNTNNLTFEVNAHNITGTDTTTSEIVFDLDINTDGTITGDLNIETVGYNNFYNSSYYSAPCIDISNINSVSAFNWNYYFRCFAHTEYILLFRCLNTVSSSQIRSIKWYPYNLGGSYNVQTVENRSNLLYFTFTTGNQYDYVSIDLSSIKNCKNLFIYYFGPVNAMPEDLYRYTFGQSQLENLTEHGNTDSQVAVATAATTTNELDTTSTQLHNIDTGYLDQADSAIDDLDTSSVDTLLNTNDFVATANWLSTQITNFLGVNNVFSTVVYFSLVLGIILVVLGRMR